MTYAIYNRTGDQAPYLVHDLDALCKSWTSGDVSAFGLINQTLDDAKAEFTLVTDDVDKVNAYLADCPIIRTQTLAHPDRIAHGQRATVINGIHYVLTANLAPMTEAELAE